MIVDTSAPIAVVKTGSGYQRIVDKLAEGTGAVSTGTWLESSLVLGQLDEEAVQHADNLLRELGIELVPVSVNHAKIARHAYRRYGRGSGSPAKLNFGDCFAYALAVERMQPLLFVGDDFTHADELPAL